MFLDTAESFIEITIVYYTAEKKTQNKNKLAWEWLGKSV